MELTIHYGEKLRIWVFDVPVGTTEKVEVPKPEAGSVRERTIKIDDRIEIILVSDPLSPLKGDVREEMA